MIIHVSLRSCRKKLTWKYIDRFLLLFFFFYDHSRRSSLLPEETDMEMLGKDQTRAPKRKPPKYIGRYLTCLIFIQYSYFYLFINK